MNTDLLLLIIFLTAVLVPEVRIRKWRKLKEKEERRRAALAQQLAPEIETFYRRMRWWPILDAIKDRNNDKSASCFTYLEHVKNCDMPIRLRSQPTLSKRLADHIGSLT